MSLRICDNANQPQGWRRRRPRRNQPRRGARRASCANPRRFWNSAERMAMAPLPEPVFIEAVEQLVRIDRAWMPGGEGSLYLRPFMIASEVFLGVKPSAEYIFAVIASPVGSYFKGGPAPVSIWVSENYTRAAIGGTRAVKFCR